ncbi:MAG: PEP/pyruvate-binding domain-containing protein, partial [Euryarchaeota archaeon]|nr:PEP/pyruvate-binding domain-containing protein [Euryarchaeota archaeon]
MYSIILLTEPPKELKVSEVGGKGYSLGVLAQEGFDIPNGFIILSDVFFDFLRFNNIMEKVEKLSSEIDEKNFKEKSEEIKVLILKGKIPKKIALEVKEGLEKLNSQYVSVRSSAVSEDGIKDSFAGLFDTFL